MEVITPSRGTENAKLMSGPTIVPVKSMVPPRMLTPVAELPKPIRLVVPTSPPRTVVNMAGPPEANGMMAPEPVAPVTPVLPVTPAIPVAPVAPVTPAIPAAPVAPVTPASPAAPVFPVTPVAPATPGSPVAPVTPAAPTAPVPPLHLWLPLRHLLGLPHPLRQ